MESGGWASMHMLRTCVISSGISFGKRERYKLGNISNLVYMGILEVFDMLGGAVLVAGVAELVIFDIVCARA